MQAAPASPEPTLPSNGDEALVHTLWQSPYMATLQNEHFRFVDVNDAFAQFCGRPREALRGMDPLALQPEADREANQVFRASLAPPSATLKPPPPQRRRLIDSGGEERWFELSARPVCFSDGRWMWLGVLQDVTAEHRALEASRRAQDELVLWFEMCPAAMLVFDDSGAVVRTNAAFEALVGTSLMKLDDAPAALRWLIGWQGSGAVGSQAWYSSSLEREGHVQLGTGGPRRLLARVRGLPGDDRRRRAMAVLVDRSAEEERDLARREIDMLMDTASIGVATFDTQQGWLDSGAPRRRASERTESPSDADLGIQQARQGSLQGITREMVDADSAASFERLQQALRERRRAEVRYAVNHPESGRRWLLTRVQPQRLGDRRSTLSVVTLDITDQELARQRNEQLLRELTTILEGSSAGIAYLRGGILVRCNLRFERMLGLAPGEGAGASLAEAFGRRLEVDTLLPAVAEALQGEGSLELELPLRARAGAPPQWYALSLRRAESTGQAGDADPGVEAVAALTDISRLKAQAHELDAALRERALMFDLSAVGIAQMQGSRIERANQAMAELTGYAAAELTTLDGVELYESARECVSFEAAMRRELQQAGRFQGERRLRRRDGRLVWVQVSARPVDEASPEGGLIASFVDVDERNRARQSLQLQAEQTRAVLDSVLVGIITVSSRGIEWMNRSARRMFGGELAHFVGEDLALAATEDPAHPLRRSAEYLQRLAEGQAETFECQLRARDGRCFWVAGNVVMTGRSAPGQGQLTFALLDIERRRQAEMQIAQAQASLQRVIETAPLAIAVFDAGSHRVLQLNQMAAAFFARPLDHVLGLTLGQCMAEQRAATTAQWLAAAAQTPEVLKREWREESPLTSDAGGTTRVWDVRIVALAASDAAAAQLLLAASDVTEQREAEQARLQAAIAQREVLVREVHHRIKNNLQGVAGLLQHSAFRHPEMAMQLNEAVSQVHAIAQVYGLQVGSAGPPRLAGVLQAIAGSVARTFGRDIRVQEADASIQSWVLPEAEAIPVALVLNELLTNAVKHGEPGTAVCGCVALAPEANGTDQPDGSAPGGVMLTVRNRARLVPGFSLQDYPGGVSGLGLVRALVPRKSATLSMSEQDGEVVTQLVLRTPSVRPPAAAEATHATESPASPMAAT